ncbi:unnamed protein product [Phytomonas sp. Hart1]|nr:unnamed protein product [Phytomonas sp. Hart1]|eukprot:CCW70960.1 unnamed protein product [Phytomonas sp. isolate Hart1]
MGLVQLPLRGNPRAALGLLAHPGDLVDAALSHDGAVVFTAGGADRSVLQWRLDPARVLPPGEQEKCDRAARAPLGSGVPADHLIAALEGGPGGKLMKEIVDYFFYAQIRDQGEETTAKHELLGAVPFAQVANLMRALGYYPTEMEIGHLTYEVANLYGPRDQTLGDVNVDRILLDFEQFLRLYVNYRPVFGISRRDIEQAFLALGAERGALQIATRTLFDRLGTKGEALNEAEIAGALNSLLGEGVQLDMLEDFMTARLFAQNMLGFEDYDTNSEGGPKAAM